MKNFLLLTTFVCSAFFADAQFTTGQKLISGQFGISFTNAKITNPPGISSRMFNFSFSPSFSRFKSPTLMTGAGIYYSYNRSHFSIGDPVNESVQPLHSFGLFVNRTKLEPLAKKFYFTYTGTVSANYQTSHPSYPAVNPVTWRDSYGVSVSGSIGLLYELSPRFLLSFDLSNLVGINYSHTIETGKSPTTVNYKNVSDNFGLSTNLGGFNLGNVGIGVKYMLKK